MAVLSSWDRFGRCFLAGISREAKILSREAVNNFFMIIISYDHRDDLLIIRKDESVFFDPFILTMQWFLISIESASISNNIAFSYCIKYFLCSKKSSRFYCTTHRLKEPASSRSWGSKWELPSIIFWRSLRRLLRLIIVPCCCPTIPAIKYFGVSPALTSKTISGPWKSTN